PEVSSEKKRLPPPALNLVPVDWASSAIVELSLNVQSLREGRVFHIINPHHAKVPVEWSKVVRWIETKEGKLKGVEYEKWKRELHEAVQKGEKTNALAPLLPYFQGET